MARKARRSTAKAAAAQPAAPPPPADQDGENSTTGTAEGVATPVTGVGTDQLSDGAAHDPSGAVDAEKSRLEGVPADASAPMEVDAPAGGALGGSAPVANGTMDSPASAQPASDAIAAPVFPSPASLPPIPSTSQQSPTKREYTAEEVQAWRGQQIDAKQAEVRPLFS